MKARRRAAPHIQIGVLAQIRDEVNSEAKVLEERYGVPLNALPGVLRWPARQHPKLSAGRRYDSLAVSFSQGALGWRTLRDGLPGWHTSFLHYQERHRRALIEVRKLRSKRAGRGKPTHKERLAALRRREDREWRGEWE